MQILQPENSVFQKNCTQVQLSKGHKSAMCTQKNRSISYVQFKRIFQSCTLTHLNSTGVYPSCGREGKKKRNVVFNKNDFLHVYSLKQFFESCADMQVDEKDVTQALRVQQKPLPRKSKTHGVIWASGGEEYDENYDVYEHLDKVPITMPPPLGPQDYMHNPHHCNVFYNAPQEHNTPSTEQLLASFSNAVTENNSSANKATIYNSVPPVPPSFLDSVISQGKSFEGIIPHEIKGIISNLPQDSGQRLFNFIMFLGTSPKLLIDKLLQENSELRKLQKDSAPNTQQMTKIIELTEQVQSLTKQNEVMNTIIDTQIPICKAKFIRSTQTDFTPEIIVNEIVQKECASSNTQTLPVKTIDFSSQTHSCCKEHVTSEFQCQASLSKLPHLTQETQTSSVKTVHFWSQTNIPDPPKITEESHNSVFQFENQQLKIELSQLQSEYSSLQEFHENLNGRIPKGVGVLCKSQHPNGGSNRGNSST